MNNKRSKRPYLDAELPLDTALNPGVIIFNESNTMESGERFNREGGDDSPDEEG